MPRLPRGASVASVAKARLGRTCEAAVRALFLVLMGTTLVSQLAKAGALLAPFVGHSYAAGSCVGAVAMGCVSYGPKAPRTNAALSAGFAAALAALFVAGFPAAQWSRLGRASYPAAAALLPTALQLLVFAEIVPTVCDLLGRDPGRVRKAVVLGGALPFVLETAWSALGLALVPWDAAAGTLRSDPVNVLLAGGAGGTVAASLAALAACAIGTTVIGTLLAVDHLAQDTPFFRSRKWLARGLSVGAPLLVALAGPGVYFSAIDWAGSYPVALLWCVFPPVTLLKQRREGRRRGSGSPRLAGPDGIVGALGALGVAFLAWRGLR